MSESHHPIKVWKGRGAVSAVPHRFESLGREVFEDGWDAAPADDPQAPPVTEVRWEDVRSALVRNDSPDIAFDYAVNPYRGCEHGCTYCYARPTHSYLGLSPGLDFERVIIAKRGLAGLLRQELARPSYQPSMIVLGSATDCYQPVERRLRLTRALIEVLRDDLVVESHRGDPLAFVRAYRQRFKVSLRPGLPRFCGGLAGYFGYDLVRFIEPKLGPCTKPDPIGTPDMLFLLVDELAIVDNLRGKLYLVVYADARSPDAWTQTQKRLRELKARLKKAVDETVPAPGPEARAGSDRPPAGPRCPPPECARMGR